MPEVLPKLLPEGWLGPFVLLVIIFVLSGFLDNIAAALIGATVAASVVQAQGAYRLPRRHRRRLECRRRRLGGRRHHNDDDVDRRRQPARRARSLRRGLRRRHCLRHPGALAAAQAHGDQPRLSCGTPHRLGARRHRLFILVFAIITNVTVNLKFTAMADHFPFLGVAVWVALLLAVPVRRPEWSLLPGAVKGSIFLLVAGHLRLDDAGRKTAAGLLAGALALGFISAAFDNIPLTALALKQGGYDWGFLAYAVGFGGSMLWFGSSAGVAWPTCSPKPSRSASGCATAGMVPVGYVVGFFVMLAVLGWHPHEKHKDDAASRRPQPFHQCPRASTSWRTQLMRSAPSDRPVAAAAFGLAAGSDVVGENLLWLAIILMSARLFAPLAQRLGFPAVLGELLLGVVLGNLSLFGVQLFDTIAKDPIIAVHRRARRHRAAAANRP
jgi:hypothetical protein